MANSHTIHGVLGYLMSLISTRQKIARLGFHSLCDWCFQMMWLFSGTPEDPEDDTAMEMHGADALYSAVKSLMHAIRTDNKHPQQDAVYRMIQIAKPSTMRRWSESKLPEWETTCSDTEVECTPCWSWTDWRRARKTEDPCWGIHFTGCFRSVEGSSMAAGILLIGIGRHRGSEWRSWTMVQWMATRHLGGFSNCPMAERHNSANAWQRTCAVSQVWRRRSIKWGAPAQAWKY